MKLFQIWSRENWHTPEDRLYHGQQAAETFEQACYEFAADHHAFKQFFNPYTFKWKGHKLYATEQELIDSLSKSQETPV